MPTKSNRYSRLSRPGQTVLVAVDGEGRVGGQAEDEVVEMPRAMFRGQHRVRNPRRPSRPWPNRTLPSPPLHLPLFRPPLNPRQLNPLLQQNLLFKQLLAHPFPPLRHRRNPRPSAATVSPQAAADVRA